MKSARHPIDIETLRELIAYDPLTGRLTWKARGLHLCASDAHMRRWNVVYGGTPALASKNGGYGRGHLFGGTYYAHRVAWALHHGEWPAGDVDHINHDRADNRICNLRDCSAKENKRNLSLYRNNKLGEAGIYWVPHCRKWKAIVGNSGGRQHYLGLFEERSDAVAARKRKLADLGFHPNHGRAA